MEVGEGEVTTVEGCPYILDQDTAVSRSRVDWTDCVTMEGNFCINKRTVEVCSTPVLKLIC